ncbi:hypothetical protein HK097_006535, partial [Rhizophlyctis rosea]
LQKELTTTRAALRECRRRNGGLEGEVDEVRGALVEWVERCGELEREVRKLRRESNGVVPERTKTLDREEEDDNDHEDTTSPPRKTTSPLPTLETQLHQTQTLLHDLQTQHTTLQSQHTDLQQAYISQQQHISELESLLEDLRSKLPSEYPSLLLNRTPSVGSVKGKGRRRISLLSPAVRNRRDAGGEGERVSNPFMETLKELRPGFADSEMKKGERKSLLAELSNDEPSESPIIGPRETIPACPSTSQNTEETGFSLLTSRSTKGGLIYDRYLGEIKGSVPGIKTPKSSDRTKPSAATTPLVPYLIGSPKTPMSAITQMASRAKISAPRTPVTPRRSLIDLLTPTWYDRESSSSGEVSKEGTPDGSTIINGAEVVVDLEVVGVEEE